MKRTLLIACSAIITSACGVGQIDGSDEPRGLSLVPTTRSLEPFGWGDTGGGGTPSTGKSYGEICITHSDCASDICAYGLEGSTAYCSVSCTTDADCTGSDACKTSNLGMICRKDDVGGLTPADPDAGPAPAPDAAPDTVAPQVRITAPAANAEVATDAKVVVEATDDGCVDRVELWVDDVKAASRTLAPYEFSVALQVGAHLIKAVAFDGAGNKGEASVAIVVKDTAPADPPPADPPPADPPPADPPPADPPAGAFGDACVSPSDCASGLCVRDPELESSYCTERCDAQTPCPGAADCVSAGGAGHLCAQPRPEFNNDPDQPGDAAAAGCEIAPDGVELTPLLLLLLLLLRRRAA